MKIIYRDGIRLWGRKLIFNVSSSFIVLKKFARPDVSVAVRLVVEGQYYEADLWYTFASFRTDDNEESLKKRFVTYEQATMPIIKSFEEQNLVKTLDASK